MALEVGFFPSVGEELNKMQMPRIPSLGCVSDAVKVCIVSLAFLFFDRNLCFCMYVDAAGGGRALFWGGSQTKDPV
jgi:hypothetical protein